MEVAEVRAVAIRIPEETAQEADIFVIAELYNKDILVEKDNVVLSYRPAMIRDKKLRNYRFCLVW